MPIGALGAGLITLGAQQLGQGASTVYQNRQNRRLAEDQGNWAKGNAMQANQWNAAMALYQNKYNLKQWHRENAYNSPKAQMQRFRDAGLNPHLIYGQGSSGPSSHLESAKPQGAQDVKGYDRADIKGMKAGYDVFGEYYDIKMKQAQINQVEAQTKLIDEKATTEADIRFKHMISGRFLENKNQMFMDTYDYQYGASRENYEQLKYKTGMDANKAWYSSENEYHKAEMLKERLNYQIQQTLTETGKTLGQNLQNAYQTYRNAEQKAGIGHNADPFIRMLYANEKYRPYVLEAMAISKGTATVADILKVVLHKGRISTGGKNPTPQQNSKWQNSINPNKDFLNR